MPKFKVLSSQPIRFELEGEEKILLPGVTYTLTENPYIDGLNAQGLLERKEDANTETEKPAK